MILEAIGAVGQHLSDKLEYRNKWNPEANKYSRAFNPSLVSELISKHLKQSEIFILFELIKTMNSENKVGKQALNEVNFSRMTMFRSMKNLTEKGCIFEFPDGSIMVNPKIAVLSKFRKDCLALINIWNKEMKQISKYEQEVEQEEQLF